MNLSSASRLYVLSLLAGVTAIAAAGCAVDSGPTGSPGEPASTHGASADEGTRVRAFLDAQYTRADVRHEFTNKQGQAIDCVDYAAEPGVKHLLAQGMTLDQIRGDAELPERVREYNKTAKVNEWYLAGDPDEQGRARACPEGTVPHVRLTESDIAKAGGLDAYLARGHKSEPPRSVGTPGHQPPPGVQDQWYQWVVGGWYGSASVNNTGGASTMTIAGPKVPTGVNDHSLEQVWLIGGSGSSTQTVEAGWTVADDVNYDSSPHVFIYSTAADYSEAASCYDGYSYYGCPNWIPTAGATIYPYLSLASDVSTVGGTPQHELTVDVERRLGTFTSPYGTRTVAVGWQVLMAIDGGPLVQLGYYPFSDYGSGQLATGWANEFEMGAEVCDTSGVYTEYSPNVEMGEGSLGHTGYPHFWVNSPTGHAAYQRNYEYYSSVWGFGLSWSPVSTGSQTAVNFVGQSSGTSTVCTANCVYDAFPSSVAAAESSSWTNWFYFADATK